MLCEKISTKQLWRQLEEAAIQTVIAGGMAAMGFYRQAEETLGKTQRNAGGRNPAKDACRV